MSLATDKIAAQAMLNNIVRRVERQKAGLVEPADDQRKRPLAQHVKEFSNYLKNKGSTEDYLQTTIQRVQFVIDACKFGRIDEISASRVQECLADLRQAGRSIASSNHYLRAVKMFTRWLVRDRRSMEDRLGHLSKMNADTDRRHVRRPLSVEEFALLLGATEKGPLIQRMNGTDRAILYLVGAYTGFRRNEIGSVTKQSFNFEDIPATMTVEAGYSKHRQTDVLQLRQDFSDRIQTWIKSIRSRKLDEPLFAVSDKRTAEMIRKDLAAARSKWILDAKDDPQEQKRRNESSFLAYYNDDQGRRVDFHALRMTFITNLTRSGVAPKTAQLLARHSSIDLTMNTYTMLGVVDQAAAVEALPPPPAHRYAA